MLEVVVGRLETISVLREWADRTFSGLLFAILVIECSEFLFVVVLESGFVWQSILDMKVLFLLNANDVTSR